MKWKNSGSNLDAFDHFKSQIHDGLKILKYKDLEDIVFKIELTYDKIVDILDIKYIDGSTIGYSLPPGIYETSDTKSMLRSLPSDELEVSIAIDDIRLRSIFTTNWILSFNKKSFCLTILGYTQSDLLQRLFKIFPGT